MNILKKIQSFCKSNNFELENKSILVAASGGVDSMVLIAILLQIDSIKNIGIAHCNFSLRGHESDEDEKFIKNYAQENNYKNNISFHSIKFDTKQLAEEQQKSIQLIARELRYDFFEKISQETQNNTKYDFIATAHHLSDSLETSIYHLSKGTGIAGMRGILPKRINSKTSKANKAPIIRPLLCLTKEEIMNYANQNNLKWREDASNQTQKYKRNFIRHSIIPLLKKINPDTEKTFLNTSERLRSMENMLQFHVKEFEKTILIKEDKSNLIQVAEIQNLIEPLLIISEFLKKKGFSYKQSKQIVEQIKNSTQTQQNETKTFTSTTHILYTNQTRWILVNQKQNELINTNQEYLIDVDFNEVDKFIFQNEDQKIKLTLEKCNPKEVDFKSDFMYLDLDKLQFPLVLRKWKNGDKFFPLGMKNKKNIGDFLTDSKIPIYQRNFVYVLLSKNEIVWIGIIENNKTKGLRISDTFKLTKNTKNSIQVY